MVATFEQKKNFTVVGTRPIRHDGLEKVTGRAIYGADVKLPGLIWGDVLRTEQVHARIVSIDTSQAEALPGVFAVTTHKDFPTVADMEVETGEEVLNLRRTQDNVMASDKVLYKGHVVAGVAAVDRNTAAEAVRRIKVVYEALPPVRNVDEAMADDATILLEDLVGNHFGQPVANTNVASAVRHQFGDPDVAFNDCDLVVDREVSLEMVHQGYIEPHNATAIWNEGGKVSVWESTQGMFGVRDQTAAMIGLSESDVVAKSVEIGGGFGGKTKTYLAPVAAILSKKSGGLPVKMVMDRPAIFMASGPAPGGKVRVKMGVSKEGKILAFDSAIKYEAGAYPGSAVGAGVNCIRAAYDVPHSRIDAYDVVVNKPKSAAYRAPGSHKSVSPSRPSWMRSATRWVGTRCSSVSTTPQLRVLETVTV